MKKSFLGVITCLNFISLAAQEITGLTQEKPEYPYPLSAKEVLFAKEGIIYKTDGNEETEFLKNEKISMNHVCYSASKNALLITGVKDEQYDIYQYNIETKEIEALTHTKEVEFHPKYNSTGNKVIFNRQLDTLDLYEIIVLDLISKREVNIFQDTSISRTFASFSPDGNWLTYVAWYENMNTEVFISKADGSEAKNISNHEFFDGWPSWAPDSKSIVWASDRAKKFDFELYQYNLESNELKQLTDDDFAYVQPIFYPDQSALTALRTYRRNFPSQIIKIELP